VFGAVTKAYSSAKDAKKKKICSLVLELESAIKRRDGEILESKDGTMALHKPFRIERMSEPLKRLKTAKEHAHIAKSIRHNLPSWQIHNMGLKVSHNNDDYQLTAMHKKSAIKRCGFCTGVRHNVENCEKRIGLATVSHEYVLTIKNIAQEQHLRERVKGITPIIVEKLCENPMGTLGKDELKYNFVLIEVKVVEGKKVSGIDDLVFKVAFVNEIGVVCDEKIVTGILFNNLITHKLVKKKYVYDATIIVDPIMLTKVLKGHH
jgi:hypothetical protein